MEKFIKNHYIPNLLLFEVHYVRGCNWSVFFKSAMGEAVTVICIHYNEMISQFFGIN